MASRRSYIDHRLAASLWLEADMRTSDRRDDVNEKSEPVAAEHSNSAARVRELLGPAIAARL